MAQFRTTADIQNEVLEKAGEPTNGNSAYETLALTYINKAHQAIIGGGSIFSLKVDEPWTWARAKKPIILELEPAVSGTVAVVNGSRTITFSSAPTAPLEGWHFKADGDSTVYKIAEHTANVATASLDSAFLDGSGSISYKAFKLDYVISPAYIIVDSSNDKLDIGEVSASTQQAVTLTHGSYTPAEYIAHVATILTALVGTVTYSGSYDSVLRQFSITSNLNGGALFKLFGATGTNRKRSALPTLGLDMKDHSGAATYTSVYSVGSISRLIEPFKIFKKAAERPFITSIDPMNMELDYPLWNVKEMVPSLFAKIEETNEGIVTVRFNSYPKDKMRVEIYWIPVPHDLQDNDGSVPLVPRKDIDVLIHAAATFVLFDKEDSKYTTTLEMTKAGLEAMQSKNRLEMRRTDPRLGQIIPRQDYISNPRRTLRYGYEVNE